MQLAPHYNTDWGTLDSYIDYSGHRWMQDAGGNWLRRAESDYYLSSWNPYPFGDPKGMDQGTWLPDNPNRLMPFDTSPYRAIITDFLYRHLDDYAEPSSDGAVSANPVLSQQAYSDPRVIDAMLAGGPASSILSSGANTNPYATVQNRDMLRAFAVSLGLSPVDADIAAFDEATMQYLTYNQPYSEATAPAVIGDNIAARIAAKAGLAYHGMTPDERQYYIDQASNIQENIKGHREAYSDASMWTNATQVISVVLPVVGYYVGIGAAAASEAAGASTAVEVGADYTAGAAAGGLTSSAVNTIVQTIAPMLKKDADMTTKVGVKPSSLNPLALPFGGDGANPVVDTTPQFRNTALLVGGFALLKLLLAAKG